MNSELNILNKHFKKMFPFVIEVEGFELRITQWSLGSVPLTLDIYVSPTHYCELLNDKVYQKVCNYMTDTSSYLTKSVLTDWDGQIIHFRFFPDTNETTVLDGLDIS
jgi:hypothetical protein